MTFIQAIVKPILPRTSLLTIAKSCHVILCHVPRTFLMTIEKSGDYGLWKASLLHSGRSMQSQATSSFYSWLKASLFSEKARI